jgi:nucleoside-diphosphate-sugar epimerase
VSLLIVGCGYVGKAVAQSFLQQHGAVFALTRSQPAADDLRAIGIEPLVGHWLQMESLPDLPPSIEAVVVGVPHREDACSQLPADSDQHHVLGLSNLLKWLSPRQPLPPLVYLSTTGVFGATQAGERVDEDSAISPTRIGPRIAAAAEQWLTDNRPRWHSTILRLAGIYGPNRIPLFSLLKQGQPLAVVKDGMLNLIHLDDIVQAVLWAILADSTDPLYLVSDGQPIRREQFYNYLAELHHLPPPNFAEADPGSSRAARATDKLIDSQRFWKNSQLKPLHPSYREGLSSLLQEC